MAPAMAAAWAMESSPAWLDEAGGGGGGAPPSGGGGGGGAELLLSSHRVVFVLLFRKENCEGEIPIPVAVVVGLDPLVPMMNDYLCVLLE